jgi:DNA-directed RNA polymerase subunit H (RpoH/RPB5)
MHILQPKHTKLNEKESEEFLKKLNISKAQLPKIFIDDPSLQEGWEIGDIIKIERKDDETEEVAIYYRVVI